MTITTNLFMPTTTITNRINHPMTKLIKILTTALSITITTTIIMITTTIKTNQ